VLRPVLEHIEQRGARLPRTLELVRMVPVREDRTAMAERTMCRARHANRQPLHAAREGRLGRGLDDQVQMVGLNREVHDSKAVLLTRRDRAAHRLEKQSITAKAWQTFPRPERHVDRIASQMPCALAMRNAKSMV